MAHVPQVPTSTARRERSWVMSLASWRRSGGSERDAGGREEPHRRGEPEGGEPGEHGAPAEWKRPPRRPRLAQHQHLGHERAVEEAAEKRVHEHPRLARLEP